MKKKYKLMLNIGTIDARKYGLSETREGQSVDLDPDKAKLFLTKGWIAAPDGEKPAGAPVVKEEEEEEVSSVQDAPVHEAVAIIGNMRSKDKLQRIIDNDQRGAVKDAARKRLAALA